ncbi:MAG: helix-turn-helix domain-containing protein [Campylobacterales bacterium]|nr:helix-turn-helix domain-containing protein [Campylobacterales bacterium]
MEIEGDIHYQRQIQGIAKAQSRGVRFGRKRKLDIIKVSQAIELKERGYTNQQIANKFKVGRSTLLCYIAEHRETGIFREKY